MIFNFQKKYYVLFEFLKAMEAKHLNHLIQKITLIFSLLQYTNTLYSGTFSIATYNVAGLPEPFSQSRPYKYSPMIGSKLNQFDISLVQEDFNYHERLIRNIEHGFLSDFSGPAMFGDGLSQFSYQAFENLRRIKWNHCHGLFRHGSDCLTPKGFSISDYIPEPGHKIVIVNLHADSGYDALSRSANHNNHLQLIKLIKDISLPIIIAGDFNAKHSDTPSNLEGYLDAGFTDVWSYFFKKCSSSQKGSGQEMDYCKQLEVFPEEAIDKIFFRSGSEITLQPVLYSMHQDFKDLDGNDLSDHLPVAATFTY